MCMIVGKDAKIKRAEKDIECYKVLRRGEGGVLRSPYMNSEYVIGEEKALGDSECIEIETVYCFEDGLRIVYRGLHTYADYHDALSYCMGSCESVFKCVIPKGALYADGFDDSIFCEHAYASDRLRVVRECMKFKNC